MKNLIMVNGTMGAGKTATCQELLELLQPAVFLDGDWCWNMNPFIVTEENKAMVLDNIAYVLNNFIKCSDYSNIIFCWVMHETAIIEEVMSRLNLTEVQTHVFTLMVSEEVLKERLTKDVKAGAREEAIIPRSLERLVCYEEMPTTKIYVDDVTARQAAEEIAGIIQENQ